MAHCARCLPVTGAYMTERFDDTKLMIVLTADDHPCSQWVQPPLQGEALSAERASLSACQGRLHCSSVSFYLGSIFQLQNCIIHGHVRMFPISTLGLILDIIIPAG